MENNRKRLILSIIQCTEAVPGDAAMMYNRFSMECALTIAGSDPTGGAGIQADLRVFHALGVHGMAVIAALTAQSTSAVMDVYPVPDSQLREQLRALLDDIRPSALKTGMLYSSGAVNAVAEAVSEYSLGNLVIDPVAISTSGRTLLDDDARKALREVLLPLSRVVTPNTDEAAWLCGLKVDTTKGMERAAMAIRDMGPEVVVVTGGHLEDKAIEIVFDGQEVHRLEGAMMPGRYHGTGCAYSACITAFLALGRAPVEAAMLAKELVGDAIRSSYRPGGGMSILRF